MKIAFKKYDMGHRLGVAVFLGPVRMKAIRLGPISLLSVRRRVAAVATLKAWALKEIGRSAFLSRAKRTPRHEMPISKSWREKRIGTSRLRATSHSR